MYKIEKFDYDKLKLGMEVFDCSANEDAGWRKVITKGEGMIYEIETEANSYCREGKRLPTDLKPSLVAMRYIIEIDDVPTKEFEYGADNYLVERKKDGSWSKYYYEAHKFYGTKYYTRENAELLCKLLNKEILNG